MWQVLDLLKKVDLNMLKAGILEQLRPSLSLSVSLSFTFSASAADQQ